MEIENVLDYIHAELPYNDQAIANEFVKYLEESEMEFVRDNGYWKNKIYYLVKYNGECVCFIAINDPDEKENRWTVWSDDKGSSWLEDDATEKELKESAWKHVDFCGKCGSCGGGRHKVIFGKEFCNVCGCTFRIDNPGASDLTFLKKMADIRKNEIRALSK